MKKLVLMLAANLLTSCLLMTHDAYASSHLGLRDLNCSVGGQHLVFTAIKDPTESLGIFRANAKIDNEAYLSYTYNIFYSIGGEVSFVSQETSSTLLRWDGFGPNVLNGSVEYKGLSVECQM